MDEEVERDDFTLPKPLRNALISAGVLLVLFLLAGVAYTFFEGSQPSAQPSARPVASKSEYQPIIPHKPSPKSPESAVVENIYSPVKPGDNTSITVKTLPGSTCDIAVEYNDKPAHDSGLQKRTADEYGTLTWSWTVDKTAPKGTWPVTVTCAYNKKSAMVEGQLEVQ